MSLVAPRLFVSEGDGSEWEPPVAQDRLGKVAEPRVPPASSSQQVPGRLRSELVPMASAALNGLGAVRERLACKSVCVDAFLVAERRHAISCRGVCCAFFTAVPRA